MFLHPRDLHVLLVAFTDRDWLFGNGVCLVAEELRSILFSLDLITAGEFMLISRDLPPLCYSLVADLKAKKYHSHDDDAKAAPNVAVKLAPENRKTERRLRVDLSPDAYEGLPDFFFAKAVQEEPSVQPKLSLLSRSRNIFRKSKQST
jgi:hypothetical protein